MTTTVVCNLADGVVLGADSALTITGTVNNRPGALNIYNDAEKLFTLWDLPIGIASFGIATIDRRTIQSYISEFEKLNDSDKDSFKEKSLEDISEALWRFFNGKYEEFITPEIRKHENQDTPDDQLPRPVLGLMVGGYSPGEYLSEVWDVFPNQSKKEVAIKQVRRPGNFGAQWGGQNDGIVRFHKGFDTNRLDLLVNVIGGHFNQQLPPDVIQKINDIYRAAEFRIVFDAMPLQEGIDYVKFCLDIMINQSRFVIGAETCGGNVRIAVIKKDKPIEYITNNRLVLR
ncbi:MAG: hypothetical protein HQ517_02435 [SAR324 cluster bacterium]|nr:hypothetical protein [SAR324 cluster bacterium]